MIEKTEDENASFQLGQKISLLPEASQLFYTECIIKEVDDIDSYHNEVLAVLNYELIVLALKTLDKNEISIDSLKELLPWVRDENRESWKVMLATAEVDEVFPWLDEVLKSRKNLLVGSTKIDFESKFAGLFEKGRGRKLVTRTSLESDKLPLYDSLLRTSAISYSTDNSINDLMEILKKYTKNQLPFYQELLAQSQDSEFKDSLRGILRMQVAINAIDEGLPLTHEKLGKVIQMFDKEVRKHFEPHDINIEPKALFDAFKQHLNGLINALNGLLDSESLPEYSKQFNQQMLDKRDASLHTQVSKVLSSEAINPCNEEIVNQNRQLTVQSALELVQIEKHNREPLAYKEQARNSIPFQQGNANPLPQKPIGRQKEPVNFLWALGKGMFWACVGVLIGLVVFIAPIPVAPMLFIGWCAGAAFGLSAMKSGFSNILGEGGIATSSMFWGGGLAVIGAIIGSIVGTFLLPGLGTLSGASVGALMGTGVGLGVALVTGPLIRLGTWLYDAYKAQPAQLPNEPADINVNQMKGLGASNTCVVADEFEEIPQGDVLFANRAEQEVALNPTVSNVM